jgi:hypothetical protein
MHDLEYFRACWRCKGATRPSDGVQRLGLCEFHLKEQIRVAMGLPVLGAPHFSSYSAMYFSPKGLFRTVGMRSV